MSSYTSNFAVRLFYSYSHKDSHFRDSMEDSLSLLKQRGLLDDWSDVKILPGGKISKTNRKKMDNADIMVFLLSRNFIASTECMKEWEYAKRRTNEKVLVRIPIILSDCAWLDLLGSDDIKALPRDGKPIMRFADDGGAWQQVYEGIKVVVDNLRTTFTPKQEFLEIMEKTDFLSVQHIRLQDIFIFLRLSCYAPHARGEHPPKEQVDTIEELLKNKYTIVHGDEMSGKTALGRFLFLSLTKELEPVLHIDLQHLPRRPLREETFRHTYHRQFNGDYSLWKRQPSKTLILDNLQPTPQLVKFIVLSKDYFDKIIVTLSSDIFNSFFRDEERLAEFYEMEIEPLTHRQQETLIRNRLRLSDRSETITDGVVDQIENRVNSIIISNRIVPRYPLGTTQMSRHAQMRQIRDYQSRTKVLE